MNKIGSIFSCFVTRSRKMMCSAPAVAARIQSRSPAFREKVAHIGGVAEQEHARQTDQDADNDGLVQLQLIDHQVEDRYDDKGKAGEKKRL